MSSSFNHPLLQRTILVVDDDNFMLTTIVHVLSALGFKNVQQAKDGEQAIEKINAGDIDIVLSDIEMPNMNGLALMQHIRCGQTKAARNLPIIIITSYSTDEFLGLALRLDVNGFIAKPIKPVTLRDRIEQAMSYQHFELAASDVYQTVITDPKQINTATLTKSKEALPSDSSLLQDGDVKKVHLNHLEPKMQLFEDVLHKNDSVLLSAGQVLDQNMINRLYELSGSLASAVFKVVKAKAE